MRPQLERPIGAARMQFRDAARCHGAGAVHTDSALGLVLEGQATFLQGTRFELRPGDVYLVPAGARHRFESVDALDAWGVRFCPPCFASTDLGGLFAPFDRARAGGSAVVPIPRERQGFLATLCDELARQEGDARAQRSLLSLILTEVSRAAFGEAAGVVSSRPRPDARGLAGPGPRVSSRAGTGLRAAHPPARRSTSTASITRAR